MATTTAVAAAEDDSNDELPRTATLPPKKESSKKTTAGADALPSTSNDEQDSSALVQELIEVRFYKGTCKPSGVYKANMCCPAGSIEIDDIGTCKLAHKALGVKTKFGGEVHKKKRPSGCFQNSKTRMMYFNPSTVIGNEVFGDDSLICQKEKTVDEVKVIDEPEASVED
eukprot:CAMPEP_0197627272 /NCGR_PEP_ID=MMETSP1338-20131121/5929_1 /TAXON_ID=43686 ORGANISM="Pelagodinium beii, Strain RCC1491" /NCGR_SAMPLE_ID=MMETSP1338 /ASSEMBLY_ACC=CAM_ASM_000754 /LENGTH=169 /DNA_ID=CAMNT_0043197955 /DNA_START=32 /DNA_END=541 /DNA_ORIENTATION=-